MVRQKTGRGKMDLIRSGNCVGHISKLRATMATMLVTEIGLSMAETGRQLGLTTGVSLKYFGGESLYDL
jgi:hypothetical protein